MLGMTRIFLEVYTMVKLTILPSEGDDDVKKAIQFITSCEGIYEWIGERGPLGSKVPFTTRRMVSGIISEVKDLTKGVHGPREVQLITQGNSAMFVVLIGASALEDYKRCVYRAETTLPDGMSFRGKRKHSLLIIK